MTVSHRCIIGHLNRPSRKYKSLLCSSNSLLALSKVFSRAVRGTGDGAIRSQGDRRAVHDDRLGGHCVPLAWMRTALAEMNVQHPRDTPVPELFRFTSPDAARQRRSDDGSVHESGHRLNELAFSRLRKGSELRFCGADDGNGTRVFSLGELMFCLDTSASAG